MGFFIEDLLFIENVDFVVENRTLKNKKKLQL